MSNQPKIYQPNWDVCPDPAVTHYDTQQGAWMAEVHGEWHFYVQDDEGDEWWPVESSDYDERYFVTRERPVSEVQRLIQETEVCKVNFENLSLQYQALLARYKENCPDDKMIEQFEVLEKNKYRKD